MSTLIASPSSISPSQNSTITLTLSRDASWAWSSSSGAWGYGPFQVFPPGYTYNFGPSSYLATETLYVTLYYTDGTNETLSATVTVSGGYPPGTFAPYLDFTPPVPGNSRQTYTPTLFNDSTGVYGYGLFPRLYSYIDQNRIPYVTGSSILNNDLAVITGQPANLSVALGQQAQFTCTYTSNSTTTTRWYKNGSLVFTDTNMLVGVVSSYDIPSVSAGDYANYYCVITNNGGNTTSNTVTLSQHVTVNPTVSLDTVTLNVNEGASASITATLNTGTVTQFNWYVGDYIFGSILNDVPTGITAHSISSGTGGYLWTAGATSVYTKTWTSSDNGKVIYVRTPGWYAGDGTATTSVTINVIPVATAPPVLVTNPPASLNLNYGDAGSSMSAAFSGTGTLTYNWQMSSNSGGSWASLDPTQSFFYSIFGGGNTTTLTWVTPPGSNMFSIPSGQPLVPAGVYWIRCACTNSLGTTYSNHCVWTLTDPAAVPPTLAYRPSGGTAISIFPNAVDTGSATNIDSTSFSTKSSTSTLSYVFSGFGTGTKTGTLNTRLTTITETSLSALETYNAISGIQILYSYNAGGLNTLVDVSSGVSDITMSTPVTSPTLTNVDLSTLTVTVKVMGERLGPISDRATAIAQVDLYDVVFITA